MSKSRPRMPLPVSKALDAHCAALSACDRCGHGTHIRPIVSHARAPRAMLVGQAPGQVETGGGKPFAGRAGGTLFRWFERIGINEEMAREWLYIAAVTRCYPGPHPAGRGDRVPSREERERCSGWLDAELEILRPRLIIPVGRLAIERFLGPAPLASLVGVTHEVTHVGGTSEVVPLPHPSGASSWIHQPGNAELLDRALMLLRERFVDATPAVALRRKVG
jgi:uracil-DNA glycosylase